MSEDRSKEAKDPNLVTWDGPDDLQNPKNWPKKTKWLAVLVVSMFTFISPVASTMIAPALPTLNEELHVQGGQTASALMLSIFLLGYSVGPLFIAPMSEIYGRVPVLQLGNLVFLVFNLGCGFCKTQTQLTILRFFAGIGGSTPLGIGGGVMADCFHPEQRGLAVAIYSLMPLIGPAVGPIAGAWIVQKTTWRWIFWASSAVDGLFQIIGIFYLRESWAPAILRKKKRTLQKETGAMDLHTEADVSGKKPSTILWEGLQRPTRLVTTQPIVQALCVVMGFIYGVLYIVLSTFPTLFEEKYGMSTGIGSLNYIALGIGFWCGAQVSARCNDRIYKHMKEKNGGKTSPEYRLPMMFVGAGLTSVGLGGYAGTAGRVHWIAVDIFAAIFSAGTIISFQCCQIYLIDTYTTFAASAIAAGTILRSTCGMAFPLFAPIMYQKLGYGIGSMIICVASVVIGWPIPILLWKYGAYLRKRSPFAAEKQDEETANGQKAEDEENTIGEKSRGADRAVEENSQDGEKAIEEKSQDEEHDDTKLDAQGRAEQKHNDLNSDDSV